MAPDANLKAAMINRLDVANMADAPTNKSQPSFETGLAPIMGRLMNPPTMPTNILQNSMEGPLSIRLRDRVEISRRAAKKAAAKGARTAQPTYSKLGPTIIMAPTKPAIVASQRRQPTFSFRTNAERAVVITGDTKITASASANGRA